MLHFDRWHSYLLWYLLDQLPGRPRVIENDLGWQIDALWYVICQRKSCLAPQFLERVAYLKYGYESN